MEQRISLPVGVDIVDERPNLNLTPEEDRKAYIKRFRDVYGVDLAEEEAHRSSENKKTSDKM